MPTPATIFRSDSPRRPFAALRGGSRLAAFVVLVCALFLAGRIGFAADPRFVVWWTNLAWLAVAALATAHCGRAALRLAGQDRVAFLLFGGGSLFWTIATATWAWYELARGVATPFPSAADVGYLVSPILLASGFFAYRRAARGVAELRLASLGAVFAAVAIAATAFFSRQLQWSDDSRAGAMLGLALAIVYLSSFLIACYGARAAPAGRRRVLFPMLGGVACLTFAETATCVGLIDGSYRTGAWFDVFFIACFALVWRSADAAPAAPPLAPRPADGAAPPADAFDRLAAPAILSAVVLVLLLYGGGLTLEASATLLPAALLLAACLIYREVVLRRSALALLERTQASERRIRDFIESASDWLWETDAEGRYAYLSENFTRVTGVPVADVVGCGREDHLRRVLKEPEALEGNFADFRARRPFRDVTYWIEEADGPRCYSVSGLPIHGADGAFLGYRGVSRDVTPVARAAADTARAVATLEAIHEAVVHFDADAAIVGANAGAERVYGLPAAELIGRPVWFATPQAQHEAIRVHLRRMLEGERLAGLRTTILSRDGQPMLLSVSLAPLRDQASRVVGGVAVGVDVTRQVQVERALLASETRFRDFADAASDWYWELDAELRTTYLSPRFFELMRIRPEERLGKPWFAITQEPEDRERWVALDALMRRRDPVRDFVLPRRDGEGRRCLIRISARPYFSRGGDFLGYRGASSDVTAEIRAAAERDYYARIVDSSEDAIIGFDADGAIRAWNRGAELVYGWKAEEALGRSADLIAPIGGGENLLANVRRACAGEQLGPYQAIRARKDGENLNLSVSLFPVRDAHGAIVGAAGIGRNVTRLLEAERAARESEARFRDFAEAASDWFWESDAGHRLVYLSPRYEGAVGMPAESRLGRLLWEVPCAPADAAGWARLGRLVRSGAVVSDVVVARPDGAGRRRILSMSGRPRFGEDGALIGYRGLTRDVTEQHEQERRFAAALDSIEEGVAIFDSRDRLVVCNRAYRDMTPQLADRLLPGVSFERILRLCCEAGLVVEALGREAEWIADRLAKRRDGASFVYRRTDRWVRVRDERLPDGGIFLMVWDVTEERQRDERLRQAQNLEAIGRLTGGVAHDFNNLLTVILGNVGLVRDGDAPEAMRERMLGAAMRAAGRGAELTRRMLAFARRQPLEAQPTDVNALARDTLDLLRRTLGDHIDVTAEFAPGLPAALVDPGELGNVLINLAVNARDAMPQGGRLALRTWASADGLDGEPCIALEVSDTGSGMSPEVAARVFEPFFTTKPEGQGTGLGLSMVYGFVTQSKGRIDLRTGPGEGAAFTILLPLAAGAAAGSAGGDGGPGGGESILLVEDERDVRGLVAGMLENLGYRVTTAADGPTALAIAEAGAEFSLLVTDYQLPGGLNGVAVAERLTARQPDLRVLVVSGFANLEQGVALPHPLLAKPFERRALATAVRAALDGGGR